MFDIINAINTITATVMNLGYVRFGIIIVVNLILWRLNGLLGLIATIVTFAYLLNLI